MTKIDKYIEVRNARNEWDKLIYKPSLAFLGYNLYSLEVSSLVNKIYYYYLFEKQKLQPNSEKERKSIETICQFNITVELCSFPL